MPQSVIAYIPLPSSTQPSPFIIRFTLAIQTALLLQREYNTQVTKSADIELAVDKSIYVRLFNNGQDCAGPDIILVHTQVADYYIQLLQERLKQVVVSQHYLDDSVRVGPLFEEDSLLDAAELINKLRKDGATISCGGYFDLKHNVMHPTVITTSLYQQTPNFTEIYAPLFVVTTYDNDQDLGLYFDDDGGRYKHNEMYISLFGESNYVSTLQQSIILHNKTIHDVERGTEEYGGYGHGASSVSCHKHTVPKPLLIPREIYNHSFTVLASTTNLASANTLTNSK